MMSNRGHLPAGQHDISPGMPGVNGSGSRRGGRNPHPYTPMHPYHHPPTMMHYHPSGYMGNVASYGGPVPYGNYGPQQYNGAMPNYMGYPSAPPVYNGRSPPAIQQYGPMAPQGYARPQHSPVVSVPYAHHPPPVASSVSIPPSHTPSSTHSSFAPPAARTMTPTPQTEGPPTSSQYPPEALVKQPPFTPSGSNPEYGSTMPPQMPQTEPQSSQTGSLVVYQPVTMSFPWYSVKEAPFPKRIIRSRRRRRIFNTGVDGIGEAQESDDSAEVSPESNGDDEGAEEANEGSAGNESSVTVGRSELGDAETGAAVDATVAGEEVYAATTPKAQLREVTANSAQAQSDEHGVGDACIVLSSSAKDSIRFSTPGLAVFTTPASAKPAASIGTADSSAVGTSGDDAKLSLAAEQAPPSAVKGDERANGGNHAQTGAANGVVGEAPESRKSAPVPAPVSGSKPMMWSRLFVKQTALSKEPAAQGNQPQVNGSGLKSTDGASLSTGSDYTKSNAKAEALRAYHVGGGGKLAFLEPRGLINTGNMCYMNSVLQALIFCIPFYQFLEQVNKKASHSFVSKTPMLDATINFMREFKPIDSAVTAEQLRRRLRSEELEQYGEPFIPEFVYNAVKSLPRFSGMIRGHQQDAEEFLGFLLSVLEEECEQELSGAPAPARPQEASQPVSLVYSNPKDTSNEGGGWLEVGPRQKAAVTRTSGRYSDSNPITKIFGGQLRSELRVSGMKPSVTLEPYQPLQLGIDGPEVRNIVDALRGLTRPEHVQGKFDSPQGNNTRATKQILIESLPPFLILHLKRFQFDAEGRGTVKISKKIGYPLDLDIPRDILSRQSRSTAYVEGTVPRYRLAAVVYHHGKNSTSGHYTVDVRRQDSKEWIRLDDTSIKRVRSEDVAESGRDEDVKPQHADSIRRGDNGATNHWFGAMNDAEVADDNDGWKTAPAGKKWSSIINGSSSPGMQNTAGGKSTAKENVKDNKVAYLLFYERVHEIS